MDMDERYTRQTIIDDIGRSGQARLAQARVVVVGAGGLGCPALVALVGAGVGEKAAGGWIKLLDPDTVEVTNLNRQFLYHEHHIGHKKVDVAAEQLRTRNSLVDIHPLDYAFDSTTAKLVFADPPDVVIDCTDTYATRLSLNHWCYHRQVALVSVAISRYAGTMLCVDGKNGPCLACAGRFATQGMDCTTQGIVGTVAQCFGSLAAHQVLHYVLQASFGHSGLWLFDVKHMQGQLIQVQQDPACPVCGKRAIAPSAEDIEVGWHQLQPHWVVVDITTNPRAGLLHKTPEQLQNDMFTELDIKPPVCVALVCNSGTRSLALARQLSLRHQGQSVQIVSVKGGKAAASAHRS